MNLFFRRYKESLGPLFKDLESYTSKELKPCLRVNTLKIAVKQLIKRLKSKGVKLNRINFLNYGYEIFESEFSLGSTPEYLQGFYYIQEAASQYPVQLLDPNPGELVLDMAASPGGKTTQMAQLMQNKGKIIALDIKRSRLESLRNNCARLGVSNVLIYNKDARYASDLGIKFDKVLLDAPCSGNFMTDKTWFNKRSLEDFKLMSKTQKQLLSSAMTVLKTAGILVYSTCTLEKEEDEDNISWLKENFNVKVMEQRKFWPHIDGTQGFFVAKIKKLE
ncbi:NOL1/NOP2/sun family putative RNA methylase [Candidatus Woesearchaeota archaeon]|nr:NOL1/NOP2/sun family putative RNA methylase [Candidatus Woesearchaeota archaeon]